MAANAKTDAAREDFVIERTFDIPRDLMWKMWTDPAHLARWWGPKGFTVSHCKVDLRPGGVFHYGLRAPDGQEIWGKFVYREIAAPERIVFVDSFSDERGGITRHPLHSEWPLEMLTTLLFEDAGSGRIKVTLSWVPINESDAERKTFDDGRGSMTQGWAGTFDKLEHYLAGLKPHETKA